MRFLGRQELPSLREPPQLHVAAQSMLPWCGAQQPRMGQWDSSGAAASLGAGICMGSQAKAQLDLTSSWGPAPKHLLLPKDVWELVELLLLWAELMNSLLVRNTFSEPQISQESGILFLEMMSFKALHLKLPPRGMQLEMVD